MHKDLLQSMTNSGCMYFFTAARISQVAKPIDLNSTGRQLGNLGSDKEIQPQLYTASAYYDTRSKSQLFQSIRNLYWIWIFR